MKTLNKDIGMYVDTLYGLKEKKKEISQKLLDLNKEITNVEFKLLDLMKNQELFTVGNDSINVFRKSKTVPKVVQWDEFYEFIYREKAGHLLERRPSLLACREMFSEGLVIPGVDPYTFEEVRTRSIK